MKKTVVGVGVIGALVYFMMGGLGLGIGPDGAKDPRFDKPPETETDKDEKSGKESDDVEARPCSLRLDRRGLWLEDRSLTVAQAVADCRKAGRASVTVTGDARQGDLDKLNRAFEAAGIEVLSNR